ncbi:MAG: undecaprenyl-diphosphate phosphatase [Phycisphaerales bacterium]|nr:undecaprenyl-diphosphate phosphatase [Phycisphaeraceae bacterium]
MADPTQHLNLIQAAVLGLVEGITEYLPVSSTGHLIIASDLMKLGQTPESARAIDSFNIVIQGGAILAVAGLYFPRFVAMLAGLIGKNAAGLRLFINLIIAFMPAAIVGLLVHDWIEERLMSTGPVAAALIVGGVFMIVVDRMVIGPRRRAQAQGVADASVIGMELDQLRPAQALGIGLMQLFALVPGTSRSMMTIVGGVMVGLRPAAAAEFSFLLGMPTLLAATMLALFKDLKHASDTGGQNLFQVLGVLPVVVGIVVAAVSAAIAVKWLVGFLNRHGLMPFGVYRIVIGAVLIALAAMGLVTV